MHKPRNVSTTGRILTPNRLRSPLTDRRGAAFLLSFAPQAGGAPTLRVIGDTVVVQAAAGGILIDLAAARILGLPQEEPRPVPDNLNSEFLGFLGMSFVELPLLQGARVHLAAPILLDSRAGRGPWVWVTCPRLGPVVLTLLH